MIYSESRSIGKRNPGGMHGEMSSMHACVAHVVDHGSAGTKTNRGRIGGKRIRPDGEAISIERSIYVGV